MKTATELIGELVIENQRLKEATDLAHMQLVGADLLLNQAHTFMQAMEFNAAQVAELPRPTRVSAHNMLESISEKRQEFGRRLEDLRAARRG